LSTLFQVSLKFLTHKLRSTLAAQICHKLHMIKKQKMVTLQATSTWLRDISTALKH